jgi:hypothetical protein
MEKKKSQQQEQQRDHDKRTDKGLDKNDNKGKLSDENLYPAEDDVKEGSAGNEEKDITV